MTPLRQGSPREAESALPRDPADGERILDGQSVHRANRLEFPGSSRGFAAQRGRVCALPRGGPAELPPRRHFHRPVVRRVRDLHDPMRRRSRHRLPGVSPGARAGAPKRSMRIRVRCLNFGPKSIAKVELVIPVNAIDAFLDFGFGEVTK